MTYDDMKPAVRDGMQNLIESHGLLAVGLAFLRAALARKKHPPDLMEGSLWLSPHLRRDMGLPPYLSDRHLR